MTKSQLRYLGLILAIPYMWGILIAIIAASFDPLIVITILELATISFGTMLWMLMFKVVP